MIKVRILRDEFIPEIAAWALNKITCILIGVRQKEFWELGGKGNEIGAIRLQAKELLEPPADGIDKEQIFPQSQ